MLAFYDSTFPSVDPTAYALSPCNGKAKRSNEINNDKSNELYLKIELSSTLAQIQLNMEEQTCNLITHHPKSSIMFNMKWAYREDKMNAQKRAEQWRDEEGDPLRVWVKCDGHPWLVAFAGTRETFRGTLLANPVPNNHDPQAVHMKILNYTKRNREGQFGPIKRNYVLKFFSKAEAEAFKICLDLFRKEKETQEKFAALTLDEESDDLSAGEERDAEKNEVEEQQLLEDDFFESTQDPFASYFSDGE